MNFVVRNAFGLPVFACRYLGEVGDFLGDAKYSRDDVESLKVDKNPTDEEFGRRLSIDYGLYNDGYDRGCDVENKHLEPMPEGMPYSWRCGYYAGLSARGAYYRINDL